MNRKAQQKILRRVIKLHDLFQSGAIPTLAQHEVHPEYDKSSRENYLYFTLPPSINFQRSSPAMWASALKTAQDPETSYLFLPEQVVQRTREEVQRDLLKHKLALQRNKHTDIWITLSTSLYEPFGGDPRKLFEAANWDVVKIQQLIQKEKRRDFPYISGPKMANYWLYILTQYTDAKFSNMQEISIIPDTHVLQCTVQLGLAKSVRAPLVAAKLWKQLLEGSPIAPVQMHPVLWNWSRNNFKPEV